MTIQAQRGPHGSLLLDLDSCGLYQIDAPALAALLRDGMQVPLYPTEFSSENAATPAGHAILSGHREAVRIAHYRTGRQFLVPASWLIEVATGAAQTAELREIIETET
jgi:hypothetical protein